jgi:hypothetical protein
MDRHIDRDSKQLLEKYNLRAPQADEKAAREIGEDTTDLVIQRSSEIKRMMRTLNYKSSGTFVDSFERLIELQEGPDALGKPKTVDERNYLLAERLIQPEYAEEREHFGHIQERAFQLHSRFSDGERSQSNAGAIRNSQFALDTKVFELDKERFPDDIERSVGKHERNADAYALNYLEAVKNGDEKEAAIEARKYHASVMKVDDDRRRDENAISVDCERTNKEEKELPAGDPRQVTELERGDDVTIEFEGGAYLPLPGYGLERLERDSGDLMSDPSDIQIELTSDELRRRRDDDEHEEGRQL